MERLRFEGINWDGEFFWAHPIMECPEFDACEHATWVPRKGWREFFRVIRGWKCNSGHGGDEYGNCTWYFRCPLFGVVWWYPTGHYQTEVELPYPGCHPWIDKVQYEISPHSVVENASAPEAEDHPFESD